MCRASVIDDNMVGSLPIESCLVDKDRHLRSPIGTVPGTRIKECAS